jgi:hypothetical protein
MAADRIAFGENINSVLPPEMASGKAVGKSAKTGGLVVLPDATTNPFAALPNDGKVYVWRNGACEELVIG